MSTGTRPRTVDANTAATDARLLFSSRELFCGSSLKDPDDAVRAELAFGTVAKELSFEAEPIYLDSIRVEFPSQENLRCPVVRDACVAYRTTDGVWHEQFEPVTAIAVLGADEVAIIDVAEDDVDFVAVVSSIGGIQTVKFTAARAGVDAGE